MEERPENAQGPEIVAEEEKEDYGGIPSPDARTIVTDKLDISIRDLCDRIRKKTLNPRPEYQRYDVFDARKKSRLIESALLNIPIPILYFQEEADSSLSVIDGQQRLTALYEFLFHNSKLTQLVVLSKFNGKTYADLEKSLQNKLDYYTMRCIVLKKESHEGLKIDIFSRLNTGAVQLNAMEIRNCLYGGKFNKLLRKLADSKYWKLASGFKFPDKRMADVEMILRFIALHEWYTKYDGHIKSFLDNFMDSKKNPSITNDNELQRVEKLFKDTIDKVFSVFGKHSFRSFTMGTSNNLEGYWEKALNKSLFDVEMLVLADYPKNQVVRNLDEIRASLVDLMIEDDDFKDFYLMHTTDKVNLAGRVDKWRNHLQSVIGLPTKEKRIFSKSQRVNLFGKEPSCKICGNKIMAIEDAHVDHVKPYSLGGETASKNAQLTHRYCNQLKSAKSSL